MNLVKRWYTYVRSLSSYMTTDEHSHKLNSKKYLPQHQEMMFYQGLYQKKTGAGGHLLWGGAAVVRDSRLADSCEPSMNVLIGAYGIQGLEHTWFYDSFSLQHLLISVKAIPTHMPTSMWPWNHTVQIFQLVSLLAEKSWLLSTEASHAEMRCSSDCISLKLSG